MSMSLMEEWIHFFLLILTIVAIEINKIKIKIKEVNSKHSAYALY